MMYRGCPLGGRPAEKEVSCLAGFLQIVLSPELAGRKNLEARCRSNADKQP